MELNEQEFEALKIKYADQVELLRFMTKLDIQIITGYLTVQLVLGAWVAARPIQGYLAELGLTVIDLGLAIVAFMLLFNHNKRRTEVVETVKNINEALGFDKPCIYLSGKAVNAQTKRRPFFRWLVTGIVLGFAGIFLVIWFPL